MLPVAAAAASQRRHVRRSLRLFIELEVELGVCACVVSRSRRRVSFLKAAACPAALSCARKHPNARAPVHGACLSIDRVCISLFELAGSCLLLKTRRPTPLSRRGGHLTLGRTDWCDVCCSRSRCSSPCRRRSSRVSSSVLGRSSDTQRHSGPAQLASLRVPTEGMLHHDIHTRFAL